MKLRTALLAAFLLLWAMPVFSQGCAMCYSTAKATSKDGQRAISRGVVVLLLPPLSFMTLGVWLAFRYGRNRDREQEGLAETRLAFARRQRRIFATAASPLNRIGHRRGGTVPYF